MNNLKCQIKSHNGSPIIVGCMDKQCKNKKLCCWKCVAESHGSHQNNCVEIDQINTFIEQESIKQDNQSQSLNYGSQQVVQGLEQLSSLIDSLQKIIKERIQKLKQQNLQEYLKKTQNNQKGIEFWNEILEGILQYVDVNNFILNLQTSKVGQLNQTEEREIKFIQQSGEAIYSIINQINPIQLKIDKQAQMKTGKIFFDENRKNGKINLQLKKFNQLIRQWPLFVKDLIQEVRVIRLALIYRMLLVLYQLEWEMMEYSKKVGRELGHGQLGHGQYLINNYSKKTLHHTDQEFDCKQKGFYFKTGDKIQIKYDHLTKVLEFRKQSNQNAVVRMPITDMAQILYPCVLCNSFGDQVQIVEY